jgi:hypothetical protein
MRSGKRSRKTKRKSIRKSDDERMTDQGDPGNVAVAGLHVDDAVQVGIDAIEVVTAVIANVVIATLKMMIGSEGINAATAVAVGSEVIADDAVVVVESPILKQCPQHLRMIYDWRIACRKTFRQGGQHVHPLKNKNKNPM